MRTLVRGDFFVYFVYFVLFVVLSFGCGMNPEVILPLLLEVRLVDVSGAVGSACHCGQVFSHALAGPRHA